MLNEMTAAPDFALSDAEGRSVRLSDLRGQWVVLYFYPRDNTPGCTRQACAFAAAYDGLRQKGAVVVGVSKDSAASHKKFAEKHGLPFVLLSDPDHAVLELYDVWKEHRPRDLSQRPGGGHPQGDAQSQAGHQRRRRAGGAGGTGRVRQAPAAVKLRGHF